MGVVGGGALGTFLASRFLGRGADVRIVTRAGGSRHDELKREHPHVRLSHDFGALEGAELIFLCVKAYEYHHKWEEGITLSSNLFGSFYYTLTGLHVLHVTGGLILMAYILIAGSRGQFTPDSHDRVECAGLYWHFVDLVWVILFPILYLL